MTGLCIVWFDKIAIKTRQHKSDYTLVEKIGEIYRVCHGNTFIQTRYFKTIHLFHKPIIQALRINN